MAVAEAVNHLRKKNHNFFYLPHANTLLVLFSNIIFICFNYVALLIYVVGPCHHGMARPQVADRGTASDKEGSCE